MMSRRASDEAVSDFVSNRWGALVRFGYLMTGDATTAEDLVQEALAKCLPRWQSFDPQGTESYVRTVMARLAWKRAKRPRTEELSDDADEREAIADRSARAADVAQALDRLPPDQRVVVVLRHWLDYTEAQIADVLGCRAGTVKSRASRAYAQLRTDLGLADYAAAPSNHTLGRGDTQ